MADLGALGGIPFLGPIASGIGAIISGAEEMQTADQQRRQAANLRQQGLNLQVEQLRPEFRQKYFMDLAAAQGGLPALELYKQYVAQNTANNLRAIRDASPSGASTVNAINNLVDKQNTAINMLNEKDAIYRNGMMEKTGDDLWNIGTQERGLELYRNQERDRMLGQANALEAAGTANKQTGINTITGAAGSTANDIFSNTTAWNNIMGKGPAQNVDWTKTNYNW